MSIAIDMIQIQPYKNIALSHLDPYRDSAAAGERIQIGPDRFVEIEVFFDDTTDTEIVARIYNAAGEEISSFYVFEDSDLNNSPRVVARDGGGFTVTWLSQDDDDLEDTAIYSRTYDENGNSINGLNTIRAGEEAFLDDPDIASLSDGKFVVVFENGASDAIQFQLLNNNGQDIGGNITVDTDIDTGGSPTVEALSNGNFRVIYQKDGDTLTQDYDGSGTPIDSNDQPDATITGTDSGDNLRGTNGDDVVDALDGNDFVSSLRGDDIIYGGEGADRIYGGANDDILYGGEGRDVLFGGKGNDILFAGAGDSGMAAIMTGNSGNDIFGFETGFYRAVIRDFENGIDQIYVDGGDFDDLFIRENRNGDAMVQTDLGLIILAGVDQDELDETDFIFDDGFLV